MTTRPFDDATSRPIVVTGATGNVGREVVRALRARGRSVRVAVRDPARSSPAGCEAVRLDYDDPSTFVPAVRGARGLFLLRPPAIANVREALLPLVDRAVEQGVEHVVFLSVLGADRRRWVPHHAVERHLIERAVPATLFRAGFFAQNLGDAYREDIRDDDRIVLPSGRRRVAFVDARDLGEAAAIAFDDPRTRGAAYALTGPEAPTFDEVAAVLGDALGRSIRYVPASVPRYAAHLRRRGLPWAQVLVQTVLHVGIRFGDAEAVDPALGRLLGRTPRTLADYVRDHVELWRRRDGG